jgi:Xaa-Pro aminopeptidase
MRFSAVLLAACVSVAAQAAIPLEEYSARRDALRKAIPGATLVLQGGTESPNGDIRTGFFQEANFYYFTGWTEPGAMLIIGPNGDTFFLPPRDAVRERYTGPKLGPPAEGEDTAPLAKKIGISKVASTKDFAKYLPATGDIYTLPEQKATVPGEIKDATLVIARLRMVKSPREIEMIQKATDVSIEAHRAAWRRVTSGLYEHQLAATMSDTYFEQGCERHAYAPIVGSGPNAAILHYNINHRRMDGGELVLMDVGAECSMYATDITRTIPVSKKFTKRQRELYEVVLGAQKAAIAAAKPGMMLRGDSANSLDKIARDYINTHGKTLKGEPLGKYFNHSLGHHVGLDVHDPTDTALPLQPNMVITIEPGIYIPEENIGIRIEDMLLITEDGAKVMSGRLESGVDELERFLARGH